MKVFISWSKERSGLIADALKKWLPKVIQSIEPWISVEIDKGKPWSEEIKNNLEDTKIGIICLCQENLDEPWILFEAGALAKTKSARVCTFLLDITPANVRQPLGQFNHTRYEKEDVRKLIHTINNALSECNERPLEKNILDESFDKYWEDLDKELNEIKTKFQPKESIQRPDRELLEEILAIMRNKNSIFYVLSPEGKYLGYMEGGDCLRLGVIPGYDSKPLVIGPSITTSFTGLALDDPRELHNQKKEEK